MWKESNVISRVRCKGRKLILRVFFTLDSGEQRKKKGGKADIEIGMVEKAER